MGSFEKLVVLTVLFLVTLVLGVTLNSGSETGTDSDFGGPLDSARNRVADGGGGGFLSPGGEETTQPGGAGLGLLSASVAEGSETSSRASAAPAGGLLRLGVPGLREHALLPDYRIYRVASDDTWSLLADRFYGERSYAGLLRQANEGLESPIAGEEILVPVRDFRTEDEARPRLEPWERGAGTTPVAAATTEPGRTGQPARTGRDTGPVSTGQDSTAQQSAPLTTPGTYEVVAGDVLSVISLKVYGTSRRWEEIYDANRKLLADPDTLQVGQVLTIP